MSTLKSGIGSKWSLGLEGRGYLLSTLDQESPFEYRAYTIEPIPLIIPRIDSSSEPGEHSFGSLWPRAQHSWHEGSGQDVLDSEFSSRYKSKQIFLGDPFTKKGSIKPFPGFNTSIGQYIDYEFWSMVVVGNNLFGFRSSTNIEKFITKDDNTVQGTVAHNTAVNGRVFHGIETDGSKIYFWNAALGLYSVTTNTDWGTSAPTPVKVNNLASGEAMGFVKNRLMVGVGPDMYDITDLTSLTSGSTSHFTHQFLSWQWTSFVDGGPGIFASGYSNDKSEIYHIGFDATTAASGLVLNAPRSVWIAPKGENILTMVSYLGSAILIGTSRGVRNAIIDGSGNIQVSPLIVDSAKWIHSNEDPSCKAITIHKELGYFLMGWVSPIQGGNFITSAGVIDLSNLSWVVYGGASNKFGNSTPASLVMWGDDLVVSGNDQTVQIGSSLKTTPVLTTGSIRFGTSEDKALRKLDVTFDDKNLAWGMSNYYYRPSDDATRCHILQSSLSGGRNLSGEPDADTKDKRIVFALVKIKSFDSGPVNTDTSTIMVTHGNPLGSAPTNPPQNEDILWEAVLSTGNEDSGGDTNKMAFRWKDASGTIQEAISTITLADQKTAFSYDNDDWFWFAWEFDGDVGGVWEVKFWSWWWGDSIGSGWGAWDQVGATVNGGAVSEFYKPTPDLDYPIFMGGGSYTGLRDRLSGVQIYEATTDSTEHQILEWWGNKYELDIYGNLFTRIPRIFDTVNNVFLSEDPPYPLSLESFFGSGSYVQVKVSINGSYFEDLYYKTPWNGKIIKMYGDESLDLGSNLIGVRFDLSIMIIPESIDSSLSEWRLRSEPIPKPRYLRHYVPIMLYDRMTTIDGSHLDRKGFAQEELTILKDLYRDGSLIDFQPPDFSKTIKVRIDELHFKQFAPPKGASGFGGIALLVLREQE